MKRKLRRIPEEFHTLSPYLIVRDAARAAAFYAEAFGALEHYRGQAPGSERVVHCEMLLGDSRFFLKDEVPEWGATAPKEWSVTHYLYVEDCDAIYERAVKAGATSISPVADSFWGDRCGMVKDPFGHVWCIASRLEDPSPQEIQKRGKHLLKAGEKKVFARPR